MDKSHTTLTMELPLGRSYVQRLLDECEVSDDCLPMLSLINLALVGVIDLPVTASREKAAAILEIVSSSSEGLDLQGLWISILNQFPVPNFALNQNFENGSIQIQYAMLLNEVRSLSASKSSPEIIDTRLFLHRNKVLIPVAFLASRPQVPQLSFALMCSKFAPEYLSCVVRNDRHMFDDVLAGVISKARLGGTQSVACCSNTLIALAKIDDIYNAIIKQTLLQEKILPMCWWDLVKSNESDMLVCAALNQIIHPYEQNTFTHWFWGREHAHTESLVTSVWNHILGMLSVDSVQSVEHFAGLFRILSLCVLSVNQLACRVSEIFPAVATLLGKSQNTQSLAQPTVAMYLIFFDLVEIQLKGQLVQNLLISLNSSGSCFSTFFFSALVYSRTEDLTEFIQSTLHLPPLLSVEKLKNTVSYLQKQDQLAKKPEELESLIKAIPMDCPPRDLINTVHLLLSAKVFEAAKVDPKLFMKSIISTCMWPLPDKLLSCIDCWLNSVVTSWCGIPQLQASHNDLKRYFMPLLPTDMLTICSDVDWTLSNPDTLFELLSLSSDFAKEDLDLLIHQYSIQKTLFASRDAEVGMYIRKHLEDVAKENIRPFESKIDLNRFLSSSVWKMVVSVYAVLKLECLANSRGCRDLISFRIDFREYPIRRVLQTTAVAARCGSRSGSMWHSHMLQTAMQCAPELFLPERCFVFCHKFCLSLSVSPIQTFKPGCGPQPSIEINGFLQALIDSGQNITNACQKIALMAASHPCDSLCRAFLQHVLRPFVLKISESSDVHEADEEIARTWTLLHILHPFPHALELDTLNTFLDVYPVPYLGCVPSYRILAQEPLLVLRLPIPVLLIPTLLQIALIILRSAMAASTAEIEVAVKCRDAKRASMTEIELHRSKLRMEVKRDVAMNIRDCVIIRGLLSLMEIAEDDVDAGSEQRSNYDWARCKILLGIINATLNLLLSESLLEMLWAQGLTRRQTLTLNNMGIPCNSLVQRMRQVMFGNEKWDRPEQVFYQIEALLRYCDNEAIVAELSAEIPNFTITVITDVLPQYCRKEELIESIDHVLRALKGLEILQVLYLRSIFTRNIELYLSKHLQDKMTSILDALCEDVQTRLQHFVQGVGRTDMQPNGENDGPGIESANDTPTPNKKRQRIGDENS